MGVSTDAMLFYGYCYDDDNGDWPEGWQYGEWAAKVAIDRGLYTLKPDETWDSVYVPYETTKSIVAEFGCDIRHHCSNEYGIPYLFVAESFTLAYRGYPKTINTLEVGSDWNEKLEKWVQVLEITPPQDEPQWWLASYWG